MVLYSAKNTTTHGTAILGTVSGSNISFGDAVVFHEEASSDFRLEYNIENNSFFVVYFQPGFPAIPFTLKARIKNGVFDFDTPLLFELGDPANISLEYSSKHGRMIIPYRDTGNADSGTAQIFSEETKDFFFGIAQNDGLEDEEEKVATISQTSNIHLDKVVGSKAYIQSDGSNDTSITDHEIGIYTSQTDLKLKG